MSSLWTFLLIWGVWLITPVLVDGFDSVSRLITVLSHDRKRRRTRKRIAEADLPSVSVLVPAHNECEVIDRCINSIKAQDYPHDRLEIIVIDDGSTDGTGDKVEEHVNGTCPVDGYILRGMPIRVGPFRGTLALIRNAQGGKSRALNAGLEASTGDIVINIDSDVVLSPNSVRHIAEYFIAHPDVDAATGNIEIDWDILEQRDRDGNLVLDENGDLITRDLSWFEHFLVKSQFLEYLTAFDIGRRSQGITGTMYSLAGACSAFRREVFDDELEYCSRTVSEDTLLTFELHKRGSRIGFVEDARIHLEPVTDWDALYAQRVRWARGQLEVVGVHEDLVGGDKAGQFSKLALPKMLLFDHTLAFPRLIWMPLILCFPLIGYSWKLLLVALVAMYAFYLVMEAVNSLVAYVISDSQTRRRIERSEWAILVMPLYRFVVFHFRFSGFLVTLTEQQKWTMRGPMQLARGDARMLRLRSVEIFAGLLGGIGLSFFRVARAVSGVVLPLLFAASVYASAIFQSRRS
jgi:cellulose synthase/poly-beta-1,6-N-acetylglucosamine synthase-like glycosyltransferase